VADEQQAVAEVNGFQVTFKIPGRVSLGANEGAKSLRVSTATIAPDLAVRSAPVLDPTAFLEASFKQNEDAPLLPGRVAIYRDGAFVGRGKMAGAAKDETVRLGFGADDKVKIERSVVKRNEGSAGMIVTTSKTDERSFKTSVRNGHDFPLRIAIEDQLPVSENEDIVVEMLPSSTPPTATNLRDRRGVLEWAYEAKAGEVRDINFAWRVRWPKDKGVVMDNWRRGVLDRPVKPGDDGRSGEREQHSLRLQELPHFQQHELVVVRLVGIAAGGERQVVVVADDDVGVVDPVDVLDGEERKRQHAVIERLLRLVIGILDLHQIDIADLAHRLADIGLRKLDLVDALELCEVGKTIVAARARRTGLFRGAFAIVALDDEAA
jgi:hypothetical protein